MRLLLDQARRRRRYPVCGRESVSIQVDSRVANAAIAQWRRLYRRGHCSRDADVNLLLGYLPEAADDCDTADGRPAMKAFAHARLVRMIGADSESMSYRDAELMAERVAGLVRHRLCDAIAEVSGQMPQLPRLLL